MPFNENEDQIKRYVRGEILYTIYENEHEHFSIAKIKIHDTNEEQITDDEIVGKGHFFNLTEGVIYTFFGEIDHHPRFGMQYEITSYQTYIPDTKEGIIRYLSSDLFYGIGPKTANKIVDILGEQAIERLLVDEQEIEKIPGIPNKIKKQFIESLNKHQGFEQIVIYFSKYNIGMKMCQKIFSVYQFNAISILEENPYQFVIDIEGFGFRTADAIATQKGVPIDHPSRIDAGCLYVLEQSIQDGHVYLPLAECIHQTKILLSKHISETQINERLQKLHENEKIVIKNEQVYLPSLYFAEEGFAQNLHRLTTTRVETEMTEAELLKIIGNLEEVEAISYGEEQYEAIKQALTNKVMILTGGPGTGKTTVIKGILHAYATIHKIPYDIDVYEDRSAYPFILAAPTGRAAKRLQESTGLPATTIHRLLGWNGQNHFDKNEHDPLMGKYLVIDEFSMVDVWLANHLFKAIPDDMQVLLVGDDDQLPSVGPGQVLADLLSSSYITSVTLKEVYRQQEGSKIIELAHHIKNDTFSHDHLENATDFSFIPCSEQQVTHVITQIFEKAKDKGIDLKDIQVLAPIYQSDVGILELNKQLQHIVNPEHGQKRQIVMKDTIFRIGDKVIQLVNQPEDGVFNGDIGEIVAIFKAKETKDRVEKIVISFDGNEVTYERNHYSNFMHAYCISIHKSQGSEFPIVVIPVVSRYRRMLRKNLLYTAMTRAKDSLIICGVDQAFMQGIRTLDMNMRHTSLIDRLHQFFEGDEAEIDTNMTDPSDAEALSPYDFM